VVFEEKRIENDRGWMIFAEKNDLQMRKSGLR
jgi:hypothetical protein